MKLTIDNLQGQGATDYTASLDGMVAPRVERKINQPARLQCSLVGSPAGFVIPSAGARVILAKASGSPVFTGYLIQAPQFEYLGWGEQGAMYRYQLIAESDEVLLDQKALPNRTPFVDRTAGAALRQLAQDLLPGWFDTSGVQDVDTLAFYQVNPQKNFSFHAAEIALAARASYRAMNGTLLLAPVGAASYALSESDATFSAMNLQLVCPRQLLNDVTVIGLEEPQAYVRDYFVGDGLSLRFYLSQKPFAQSKPALIDEEYMGPVLDPTTWVVNDPASAVSVVAQTLQVNGGTGQDGQTTVEFIEKVELGGALELQHGDVTFTGPSTGVVGGLYAGTISAAGCLAGFQIAPSGSGSTIQALITGSPTGPVIATAAGHRYVLTTYLYSMEVYRSRARFTTRRCIPPGAVGEERRCRPTCGFVLELQDIDPTNPATTVTPATVLYDGIIESAAGFCEYALVNATDMNCSIAYTYVSHISLAEVRTAVANSSYVPTSGYVTQLVASLSNGGQCEIASSTSLDFYPQYVPPLNTLIVVSYRGAGRAVAEVENSAAVAVLQNGADNGVRGIVKTMKTPSARTQADCENAALAILEDAGELAWIGDIPDMERFSSGRGCGYFPGRCADSERAFSEASFTAIVRVVRIDRWIRRRPGNVHH